MITVFGCLHSYIIFVRVYYAYRARCHDVAETRQYFLVVASECLLGTCPFWPLNVHTKKFAHSGLFSNPTPQMKWTNYENFVNLCETTQVALVLSSGGRVSLAPWFTLVYRMLTYPSGVCLGYGAASKTMANMGFVLSSRAGHFSLVLWSWWKCMSSIESSRADGFIKCACAAYDPQTLCFILLFSSIRVSIARYHAWKRGLAWGNNLQQMRPNEKCQGHKSSNAHLWL